VERGCRRESNKEGRKMGTARSRGGGKRWGTEGWVKKKSRHNVEKPTMGLEGEKRNVTKKTNGRKRR